MYKFELNGVSIECDTADELSVALRAARSTSAPSTDDTPTPSPDAPVSTCKGLRQDKKPCNSTILLSNGYCRSHGVQCKSRPIANDARTHLQSMSVHDAALWVIGKGAGRYAVKIGNRDTRKPLNQALYGRGKKARTMVPVKGSNETWFTFSPNGKAKGFLPRYRVDWDYGPGFALIERIK